MISEAIDVVRAVSPGRRAAAYPVRGERSVNVTACSPSCPCLLPQHGPGKKHLRPIRVEPWQEAIVTAEAGRLLRGLIHSDGWRGENRVRTKGRDTRIRATSSRAGPTTSAGCSRAPASFSTSPGVHGVPGTSQWRGDAVARLDEFVGHKR